MKNNTSPPQINEFVLRRRIQSLSITGKVGQQQLDVLLQPDLLVVQDGIERKIPVEAYLSELTAGINHLANLRKQDNPANEFLTTEQQAALGLAVEHYRLAWKRAKIKVLSDDPELTTTSPAYWANVRLRYLELGGLYIHQLLPTQRDSYDSSVVPELKDQAENESVIYSKMSDCFGIRKVNGIAKGELKTSNGFPQGSKFQVVAGTPSQHPTTVPQHDLEQYQYDPKNDELWRYGYKIETGYQWLLCNHKLPTAYLTKVRKAWLAQQDPNESPMPLEEAHALIRAIMVEHDIAGAIAETEADRLFLREMMQIHRERAIPKQILDNPKLTPTTPPPLVSLHPDMNIGVIHKRIEAQLGVLWLNHKVQYNLVPHKKGVLVVVHYQFQGDLGRALYLAGYVYKHKTGSLVRGLLIKKYRPEPWSESYRPEPWSESVK